MAHASDPQQLAKELCSLAGLHGNFSSYDLNRFVGSLNGWAAGWKKDNRVFRFCQGDSGIHSGADSMLRSAAAGDDQLLRKLKSPNHDDRGILR